VVPRWNRERVDRLGDERGREEGKRVEEMVERRGDSARERRASCAGLEVERMRRRMGDGAEGDLEGSVLEAKADREDVGLNFKRRERRRLEPSADHLNRCPLQSLQLLHHHHRPLRLCGGEVLVSRCSGESSEVVDGEGGLWTSCARRVEERTDDGEVGLAPLGRAQLVRLGKLEAWLHRDVYGSTRLVGEELLDDSLIEVQRPGDVLNQKRV